MGWKCYIISQKGNSLFWELCIWADENKKGAHDVHIYQVSHLCRAIVDWEPSQKHSDWSVCHPVRCTANPKLFTELTRCFCFLEKSSSVPWSLCLVAYILTVFLLRCSTSIYTEKQFKPEDIFYVSRIKGLRLKWGIWHLCWASRCELWSGCRG